MVDYTMMSLGIILVLTGSVAFIYTIVQLVASTRQLAKTRKEWEDFKKEMESE